MMDLFVRTEFDSPAKAAIEQATAVSLAASYQFLGNVRKIARRSMRSGGKSHISAKPGEAPRYHEGHLKNRITFSVDDQKLSGVVGPMWLQTNFDQEEAGTTLPALMELGGTVTLKEPRFIPHYETVAQKRRREKAGFAQPGVLFNAGETLNYAEHPYMVPAAEKASQNLGRYFNRLGEKMKT